MNASQINASNIVGYQQTLLAGSNISIGGNTITTTADANFSTVNSSNLNALILFVEGFVSIGGIISAPNQVRFRASRASGAVINTNVILPFDKTIENVGNGYSNSTYTFTAPVTGTYFFYTQLFTYGETGFRVDFFSGSTRVQRISTGTAFHYPVPEPGNEGNTTITTSFYYPLNIGQTMYVERFDGPVNMPIDPFCHFGGYLLG